MLCGCIDIGTNTTRILVAEARDGHLTAVLQRRVFTRLGRGLAQGAAIPAAKIAETADVVAAHHALAAQLGAAPIRTVATAVIRRAANKAEFCAAVRAAGVEVNVLDGEEEARLAFLGATRTLGRTPAGRVAVVDVGGGSSEIAIGTVQDGVSWTASLPFGSCSLADAHLASDPPTPEELHAAQTHARHALAQLAPPPVDLAVAVGGSAASLRRMVGGALDADSLRRALDALCSGPAVDVAARYDLDPERAHLLPAGLLALDAAAFRLGRPLEIGHGGLREGVVLDLAGCGR